MKTASVVIIVMLFLLLPATAWSQSPTTMADFAEPMRAVQQTSQRSDDVELAESMLIAAYGLSRPDDLKAMCDAVYALAKSDPAGYPIAVEAMMTLADRNPVARTDALEKAFVAQQRWFKATHSSARRFVGEQLITILRQLADTKALNGEGNLAELYLRQALTTAGTIRSPSADAVRKQLKALPQRLALAARRDELRATLALPGPHPAERNELVALLVTRYDQPPLARKLLNGQVDQAWRSYVPVACRDPQTLPGPLATEMATWYGHLIASLPEDGLRSRAPLQHRRLDYLKQILRHQADPQTVRRITGQIRDLQTQLENGVVDHWSLDRRGLSLPANPGVYRSAGLAAERLGRSQMEDGCWTISADSPFSTSAGTALVTLALLRTGHSPRTPLLGRALRYLDKARPNDTLTLAFRCCVWQATQSQLGYRYIENLRDDATTLMRATEDGSYDRFASPTSRTRHGDPFYSQYALVGLAWADLGGARVPRSYWLRALNYWSRMDIRPSGQLGRHQLTVAKLLGVLICQDFLGRSQQDALEEDVVQVGLKWLDAYFDDGENINPLHYLYNLARLGVATGRQRFGDRNWFAWTTADLLAHQGDDGGWQPTGRDPIISTALGLLIESFAAGL